MRKIAALAAMLAVLGMASQAAEAGDRGAGFRHVSPHVGAKLHGFKLHRPGVVEKRSVLNFGKPRLFKPRHFSRFGRSGFKLHRPSFVGKRSAFKFHRPGFFGKRSIVKFGKPRLFKPRHFSRFGRSGLVFKFSDGAFALRFGHVPRFKPHPFGLGHGGPSFKFGDRRHFKPLHRPSFAFGKPRRLFEDSLLGSERAPRGTVPGPGSFEAVLKQLEEQGFRHVTKLLREGPLREPSILKPLGAR